MDQTNTSAGTAQFTPLENGCARMRTDDGDLIGVAPQRTPHVVVRLSDRESEFTAIMQNAEAIATGRELLRAAGAPDEAQQLREQRDELLAALRQIADMDMWALSDRQGWQQMKGIARAAIAKATVEAA